MKAPSPSAPVVSSLLDIENQLVPLSFSTSGKSKRKTNNAPLSAPAPYREFTAETPNITRSLSQEVEANVYRIVSTEGPVTGYRIYTAFIRGSVSNKSGAAEEAIRRSLRRLCSSGQIIEENPLNRRSPLARTYRLAHQPKVNFRKFGPRNYEELPDAEVIAVLNNFPDALNRKDLLKQALKLWERKNTKAAQKALGRWVSRSEWAIEEEQRALTENEKAILIERELDKILAAKKLSHSSDSERPFILAALNLTEIDHKVIKRVFHAQLHAVRPTKQGYKTLFKKFEMLFLTSMMGIELTRHANGFWEAYTTEFNIERTDLFADAVREVLEQILSFKGLETFRTGSLGNQKYVQLITLHAGINQEMLDHVLRNLAEIRISGSSVDDPFILAQRLSTTYQGDKVDYELNKAASLNYQYLQEAILEVVEIAIAHSQKLSAPAPRGYLPSSLIAYVRERLDGNEQSVRAQNRQSRKRTVQELSPQLVFSPDSLLVQLKLPEGLEIGTKGLSWSIKQSGVTTTVTQQYEWATGTSREILVPIHTAISTLHVSSDLGSWEFDLSQAFSNGWFAISRFGNFFTNQSALNKGRFIVIKKASTEVNAYGPDATGFELFDLGPVAGWNGWNAYSIDTDGITRVRITSGTTAVTLVRARAHEPEWKLGEAHQSVRDFADLPVYKTPLSVLIPEDNETWSLKTFAVADSFEELVHEKNDLSKRNVHLPVLPRKHSSWIGHFRTELYCNTKLVDSKTFSLAEDLEVNLEFKGSSARSKFLVPQWKEGTFTNSSSLIEFETHNSLLRVPSGWQKANTGQESSIFPLYSAENPEVFRLNVSPNPPALSFMFPHRDEEHTWATVGTHLSVDQLDPDSHLKVRFPRRVHDVTLKIESRDSKVNDEGIYPRRREIALTRSGSSSTWTCAIPLILTATEQLDDHRISVSWFDISDAEYANRQPRYERNRLWKQLRSGETISRTDRNETVLSKLSVKPLLDCCSISEGIITLGLGRDVSAPLEGWAWKLRRPLDPPVQLSISEKTAVLPESLKDKGPLIIQIREEEFLDFWSPEFPTSESRIADQGAERLESVIDQAGTIDTANFAGAEGKQQLRALWNTRFALRGALGAGENRNHPLIRQFDSKSRYDMSGQARLALNELDKSIIPHQEQIEALIRTGLIFHGFDSSVTAGDIHPVPWVGLIQELSDVRTLRNQILRDELTEEEQAESEKYIRETGSAILLNWLGGETFLIHDAFKFSKPPQVLRDLSRTELEELIANSKESRLVSPAVREAGIAQVFLNQSQLKELKKLKEALQIACRQMNHFTHLGASAKGAGRQLLQAHSTLFSELSKAMDDANNDSWMAVPLISFVFTFLARMEAHRIIQPVKQLDSLRNTWAQVARCVPMLAAYDLVCAEAIILGRKKMEW